MKRNRNRFGSSKEILLTKLYTHTTGVYACTYAFICVHTYTCTFIYNIVEFSIYLSFMFANIIKK